MERAIRVVTRSKSQKVKTHPGMDPEVQGGALVLRDPETGRIVCGYAPGIWFAFTEIELKPTKLEGNSAFAKFLNGQD